LQFEILKATSLKLGLKAIIVQIEDSAVSNKLLEMGCVPGTPIFLELEAPGRNPKAYNIDGYLLGLRNSEADCIEVRVVDIG
jgi:ferrous iron transport protein A